MRAYNRLPYPIRQTRVGCVLQSTCSVVECCKTGNVIRCLVTPLVHIHCTAAYDNTVSKSCMLKSDARQEKLELIMSSLVESQQNAPVANDSKSLVKQLLCSFIINLVGLLQGASVSTSSIILHSLHQSERSNSSIAYTRVREDMVPASAYQELVASEEEGSWIGEIYILY